MRAKVDYNSRQSGSFYAAVIMISMNDDKKSQQSIEARLTLLEKTIDLRLKSIDDKLDGIASRSDLDMAVQERNSKLDQATLKLNNRIDAIEEKVVALEAKSSKPIIGTALVATIITATITFLLTYFLEHLSK